MNLIYLPVLCLRYNSLCYLFGCCVVDHFFLLLLLSCVDCMDRGWFWTSETQSLRLNLTLPDDQVWMLVPWRQSGCLLVRMLRPRRNGTKSVCGYSLLPKNFWSGFAYFLLHWTFWSFLPWWFICRWAVVLQCAPVLVAACQHWVQFPDAKSAG